MVDVADNLRYIYQVKMLDWSWDGWSVGRAMGGATAIFDDKRHG